MKTTVLIVDDEALSRKLIRKYLEEFPEFEVLGECGDGFSAAKEINKLRPELVILDVQMPKLDGFELLELLDDKPSVIFATAFDEFAIQAFEASAIDYLLKPFSQDRFSKAIHKYLENKSKGELKRHSQSIELPSNTKLERIAVKSGNEIKLLKLEEITHLEAYDDYVKIFTDKDLFLKKQTLAYFENHLPESAFIRVHRSYLLNISSINKIEQAEKDHHQVILKNQQRIPVSKSGYKRLKEYLNI